MDIDYDNDITLPSGTSNISKNQVASGNIPANTTNISLQTGAPQNEAAVNRAIANGLSGFTFNDNLNFAAFEINLVAERSTGSDVVVDGAELTKSVSISVNVPKANLPAGNKIPVDRLFMLREHKGKISLLATNSSYDRSGNLRITFWSDLFSTYKPVVVNRIGSTSDDSDSRDRSRSRRFEDSDRVPSGIVSNADKNDTIEIKLTSNSLIPAEFIQLAKDMNLKIKATYFGTTYTGDGKNFPNPPDGRVYYDVDEFLKMLKVSKSSGSDDGTEENPSTGASDFVGLAVALGALSAAGIVVFRKSK